MSDEVGAALRELAQRHQTPPPVPPSEIRGRAVRRSRRRRTTRALAAAATAACALATVATTLQSDPPDKSRHTPATAAPETPTTRRASPTPADSLDLSGHTLTFGNRLMRVDSHSFDRIPPDRRLTVTAKHDVMALPEDNPATKARYDVKVPYVVEFRTADRAPVYAGALTFDTKALIALDSKTGWLGLSTADAQWFYRQVRVGDHIEITATDPPADRTTAPSGNIGAPPTAP